MRRIIPGLLALVWAGAGWAASNLQFAPAPSWVKAIPLPAAGTATQAAVKILLVDHQIEITPRTVKHYVESASLIQTPQGLSATGTITLVWNPDTDVLTVNKIRILRGQKVIDVLASGQTFTIAKRETNLDYASLDDTLTAILQPADLQVGDTLDVAYTLERTDPVLAGAAADEVEVSPQVPVSEFHVSAQWPTTYPVKWQATDGLGGIRQTHDGGMSGVTLSMSDLQPILEPKQAPLRFLIDRRIDFSGSGSWADVAKILTPLFERAARLSSGSPLQAEIARIRAAAPDPKARAALALALVEDKVRYVFLAMNNGGLVPADADQTWSRRYGDCKAKSVLLLALLHGLGIEARPVVVNTSFGDWLDTRLPMVELFDHVLVEATIDGQTYWLDGTRLGDRSLDHLHVPYYHWGLPLVAQGAALVKMVPEPLQTPATESTISMDASAGIARPVPFHVEAEIHDYAAVVMQQRLANLTPAQLDDGLRAFWSRQYDFVTIKSVAATYDDKNEVERMTMDGTAQLDWSGGQYAPVGLGIGYDANFERQPGPHRDAPFAVPYPIYDSNTVTIKLPLGGAGFSISGADVDRTLAGIEYRRHARIDGGVFTAVSSSRSVAPEFPAAEAAADQQALRDLSKATLDIDAPAGHTPTADEIAWGLRKSNSDADDYAQSGWMLWQHREVDAALADFKAALALDAHNAVALGNRGLTSFWMGDYTHAQADFDAALAADPNSWVALNGRGLLAARNGDVAGEIAAFSAAIHSNPKDAFALPYRAQAYWCTGKTDLALADLGEAIRQTPSDIQLYWSRALLLGQEGKKTEAMSEARLVTAANPKAPLAYLTAGAIYTYFRKPGEASAAFDQAVTVAPVARTYLMRAGYRSWTDLSGRRADVESALRLDPDSVPALVMLARLQSAAGEYPEAVITLNRAMKKDGDDARLLALRGIAYQKAGESALAQQDLAKAKEKSGKPDELNDLCWQLATADVSLESALADCQAAVAREPQQSAFQDSLGFVLLRLQRYPAAVAAYDSALRFNGLNPDSLYGRGISELRAGESRAGNRDIDAANRLSYLVASEFARYGVKP
jgi:tetratricopeptide (TPR) repeat protein/transglutaminase-like putative cysteine protease